MKSKNINLYNFIKTEPDTLFYNPLLGLVKVRIGHIENTLIISNSQGTVTISAEGTDSDGNLCIFPSKDIRDWNSYIKENTRWRADEGNTYYFICNDFYVWETDEQYTSIDNDRYMLGNYFKTKKDAEKILTNIKCLQKYKFLNINVK